MWSKHDDYFLFKVCDIYLKLELVLADQTANQTKIRVVIKDLLCWLVLGIHGEGGTFRSLLGMLMWDVIFMPDIPDAFYHLYQTQPLDLTTDAFYENRKEAFDTRLNEIRKATNEVLCYDFIHRNHTILILEEITNIIPVNVGFCRCKAESALQIIS